MVTSLHSLGGDLSKLLPQLSLVNNIKSFGQRVLMNLCLINLEERSKFNENIIVYCVAYKFTKQQHKVG